MYLVAFGNYGILYYGNYKIEISMISRDSVPLIIVILIISENFQLIRLMSRKIFHLAGTLSAKLT